MAQPSPSVYRFERCYITASAAHTPAGDAQASLASVLNQEHALHLDTQWGWLGRIEAADSLVELAHRVADPCWQAGQGSQPLPGNSEQPRDWPGIILAVSKGSTESWLGDGATPRPLSHTAYPACCRSTARAPGASVSSTALRRWGPAPRACLTCLKARASLKPACPWAVVGVADRSLQDLMLAGFRSLGVSCSQQLPQSMQGKGIGFAPSEGLALSP